MDSIYQLTFFLSLALLAIVITVFVLAVSLLGRAVRLSVEEQERIAKEIKEDNEREMEKIAGELELAKKEGTQPNIERLEEILRKLKKKAKKDGRRLRWIRMKPKLLTANWGALIPGALFLVAVIFSGLALNQTVATDTVSPYMWISLIALGLGICFVCLTLRVIQGVAITSEETAFVRQKDMFKAALLEFEKERKPKLELEFSDSQPPFRMKAESGIIIKYIISVTKGDVARRPRVYFHAPQGFVFPDSAEALPPRGIKELTNYISISVEFEDMALNSYMAKEIKIKAPSKPDDYTLFHECLCEGFQGVRNKFRIIVK